jgi:hypothetical protein
VPLNHLLSVKRAGRGWLVVFGARKREREEVLTALRVRP